MPSQISHILHGLAAADSLPSALKGVETTAAFRLGCQGPDLFYHNRRTKPAGFLYGTRLHRRGWGSFLARFRREALARGWGTGHPGLALLAGMATHGYLDRRCHPFVVYFSGWKVPGQTQTDGLRHTHMFLERMLDVRLWEQQRGQPLEVCPWQDEFPAPEDFPADTWLAWAEALHEVFPQLSARAEVEQRLRNAVADTRNFLQHTSPQRPDQAQKAALHGVLHFFHPVALPDWDFMNLDNTPWKEPVTGASRTESWPELFETAVEEARPALASVLDRHVDWEPLIGNGSLNLPGEEGENRAPVHSRPWDYAQLFDREFQARARSTAS